MTTFKKGLSINPYTADFTANPGIKSDDVDIFAKESIRMSKDLDGAFSLFIAACVKKGVRTTSDTFFKRWDSGGFSAMLGKGLVPKKG